MLCFFHFIKRRQKLKANGMREQVLKIIKDYESRKAVTLEELMPGWWGTSRALTGQILKRGILENSNLVNC